MFCEASEKRINGPQGKFAQLINLTSGEPKELVKLFIHDNLTNATRLLEKQYGNPHKLLVVITRSVVITS